MSNRWTRRDFLKQAAAGTAAAALGLEGCGRLPAPSRMAANDKLDIAFIGANGRARSNLDGLRAAGENIVALCDIDDNRLAQTAQEYPQASLHTDFRKMLDEVPCDAVVVSTPDHMHAMAAIWAMKMGKHVYCEKPLTHSVWEARMVAETAKKYGVATQMGTQIHAGDNYRRVVELIQSGAIGQVREVHVWVTGKPWFATGLPSGAPPVPETIHWDLWLGPAPEHPYNPAFHPASWRKYWDFGGGNLGDMGCHFVDLPFWALNLRHPTTIESSGPKIDPDGAPKDQTVHYQFPARGDMAPVKLTWHAALPSVIEHYRLPSWGNAVLFIGDKGQLLSDYGRRKLFPEKDFEGFEPPETTIPPSIGHYREFALACKTGSNTLCNFQYGGALTETILLGNVAFRTGRKLEWDARKLRATNCKEADQYLRREYRKGWAL